MCENFERINQTKKRNKKKKYLINTQKITPDTPISHGRLLLEKKRKKQQD